MGRWNYTWRTEYYSGCFLKRTYIEAKSREEALKKLRESVGKVTEIKCCVRCDRW